MPRLMGCGLDGFGDPEFHPGLLSGSPYGRIGPVRFALPISRDATLECPIYIII